MRSDPICWIKIKHLDMRLMGILVSHPSPALVLSLTASVNAGYVSCAEDLSVWCVAPIWSEKQLHCIHEPGR